MKIKDGYLIREIAGAYVVVPAGEQVAEFNGLMTLNETAAFIWNVLVAGAEEEDIVAAIVAEYEVDEAIARNDVKKVIELLKSYNVFE
ncbi:MAG: PqqD family protein [Clostridia bacterium]|nr:PqqD family protein [Clostridia bacterium]